MRLIWLMFLTLCWLCTASCNSAEDAVHCKEPDTGSGIVLTGNNRIPTAKIMTQSSHSSTTRRPYPRLGG